MKTFSREAKADAALMLAVIVIAATGLKLALALPPSRFDPLGSGSVPAGICIALILLAGIGLAKLFLGRDLGRAETSLILGVDAQQEHQQHPWLAVAIFAGVVIYSLALQFLPGGFFWPTAAFITLAALVMGRQLTARSVFTSLAVGLVTASFLNWLFGRVLMVVLP